jgi:putative glycosyltransferase (TIGR04372 family)
VNKNRLKSLLPKPLFSLLKATRDLYKKIFVALETRLLPFVAFQLTFSIWPLYKLCKSLNICFLANIPDSDGVGHIIVETDDFMRRQLLNELDPNKKYILIKKSHWLSKEFIRLYKHKFHFTCCSSFLYYLTLPLIMKYDELSLDCGLSRTKWHPMPPSDLVQNKDLPTWPKIITKHKNLTEWEDRYRRRVRSSSFAPLKDFKRGDKQLDQFLAKTDQIALIHLKTNISNSTAQVTDCKTYLPTIEYLLNNKYQIVFCGREKIPELFKQYDILNYAESKVASFSNDIRLFNRAKLAITGGSGIFLIAECLNVDLLYVNYWHLYRLPATRNSVCIPSLVETHSGRMLPFREQWELYKQANDAQSELFPKDLFRGKNASEDEILEGCKELLHTKNDKLTPLQMEFNRSADYYFGEPRVSEYFLQKYKSLR